MKRFVIFGVVDEVLFEAVRVYQNALSRLTGDRKALCFPVHVTLRGPFWTDSGNLPSLIQRIKLHCESRFAFKVAVTGPVLVQPDLCWFEVITGTDGFSVCRDLHTRMREIVRPLAAADDVPADHAGINYRPHMTVGWGVGAAIPDGIFAGPVSLVGMMRSIAVARYPDSWPIAGDVRVVESIPLDERPLG